MRKKVIIMGAAGRDFHNFNIFFRDRKDVEVVAFTATQIPNIEGRRYPPVLAGKNYPNGIPIYAEDDISRLIRKYEVDLVVFAYSDIPHVRVMHRASEVLASGANYMLLGPKSTMVKSSKRVISICATRTGSGKSQTTRRVAEILEEKGITPVIVRHPMPYGDLSKQVVQRFASLKDLLKHKATIEEREEYEPHLLKKRVVYAGCDYEKILRKAEKEADVVIWDGGNNDFSFYLPDLNIVVADPWRAGDELAYHPGETNLRMADCVVINKVDSAYPEDVEELRMNIRETNPEAVIVEAASPIYVDKPNAIRNKDVLVVEDGPTLTHGEMKFGAGVLASRKFGARTLVDPRPYAVGTIKETLEKYPELEMLVPAMGYDSKQTKDLERTLNAAKCDSIVSASPIDLGKLVKLNKKVVTVRYELQEIGKPDLEDVLSEAGFLD
jgi:predicted GTPase